MQSEKINPWICFIVHFLIEVICFTTVLHLSNHNVGYAVLIAVIYDMLAFYPQFLIGLIHERFKKLNISLISGIIMLIGVILFQYQASFTQNIVAVIFIALGNAFLHDCCAIQTTLIGKGTLFPTALFVGAGSFGVAVGTYLSGFEVPKYCLLIMMALIIVLMLLTNSSWIREDYEYARFNIISQKHIDKKMVIIITAFFVTTVRSYMSYAIPISWKKETWQMFLLFFMMGLGKIVGGFLADRIGPYKTGVFSAIFSIPFLVFGDNLMTVSIIGVFLFSFTMSITYGMFLSVFNDNPGFAFGLTTLALGFGSLLPAFISGFGKLGDILIVIVFSLISAICMERMLDSNVVLKGGEK